MNDITSGLVVKLVATTSTRALNLVVGPVLLVAREVLGMKKMMVVCDLCDAVNATTYKVAVDGDSFSIDLCAEDAAPLARMKAASHPIAKEAPASQPGPAEVQFIQPATLEPAAVRAWARQQGMEIADRGRIPPEILQAYRKAHSQT